MSVSSKGRPGRSERVSIMPLNLRGATGTDVDAECTVLPKETPVSVEAWWRILGVPSDLDKILRGVSTSWLNPDFDRGVEGDPEFSAKVESECCGGV